MSDPKRYCPHCGSDQRGDAIPEAYLQMFAHTDGHYYRTIGIYDMERDMTVEWKCPDCDGRWTREGVTL